ncbi:hypothetical protein OHB13_23275 [Streptomyces sp. NBC_00440]|uniref:hypothetical protein n=1 Tax=unclassified Streptomyces TaxID=2593676 RepID=UPI00224D5CE7|nr:MULTISPECIES: hypothetical protein [unclassified Streptomyces]MCX4724289.1 hypothetical protein [Streptomyces sp. NBC_01306]WSX44305.1 hypothetical protein OG760_22905 [Streptomyces sp. NBC_00963]WSX67679.1 hypothetical protein OG221_14175 [Streptomyces sp. NBC_00932]
MRAGRTKPAAILMGLAALCALTAGCGIRDTSVPVDAGAAPSRVPCNLPADGDTAQAPQGIPVRVYLVCGSRLVPVDRTVQIAEGRTLSDGVRVAEKLLDELREKPTVTEKEAGFSTDVQDSLSVSEGRKSDPAGALRLSRDPADLPANALAQIVCTYAESAAAETDGSVVLGGPDGDPPRAYSCTQQLKTRPDADPELGDLRR